MSVELDASFYPKEMFPGTKVAPVKALGQSNIQELVDARYGLKDLSHAKDRKAFRQIIMAWYRMH